MRPTTFYLRSLVYHWRAQLAVLLGVVVGTAALTGALLVGDSLRASLRHTALDRLGDVTHVVESMRAFRAELAPAIIAKTQPAGRLETARPAIVARGSATHAESGTVMHNVTVLGATEDYWIMRRRGPATSTATATRHVLINQALADDLAATVGSDILLRIAKPASIAPETLLGRRDATTVTLRLTVSDIVPAEGRGAFTLQPRQTVPRTALVPLEILQRALGQTGRVTHLLIGAAGDEAADAATAQAIEATLHGTVTLDDLGLRLRSADNYGHVALESNAFLLPPAVEAAGAAAAVALGWPTTPVLAYLANEIAVAAPPGVQVPYSTVAALDAAAPEWAAMTSMHGGPPAVPRAGEIILNDWTARVLGARPGDTLRLTYYVMGPRGRLDTATTAFRLADIVELTGAAADRGFVPEYPGVTDTARLSDWDPPFPLDLARIQPRDEAYWETHRATPKAFVTLADGLRLWTHEPERFGRLTSLRVHTPADMTPLAACAAFENALLARLDPGELGFRVDPVRARALVASRGTTDFAGLFVGFSFFLIVAAALLVALLFRLHVERRAREIGVLLAAGFTPQRVSALLVAEGAVVVLMGATLGLIVAYGYAGLLLAGLQTWWFDAVQVTGLLLAVRGTTLLTGFVASLVVALGAVSWALHGVTRVSARRLLAGAAGREHLGGRRGRPVALGVAVLCLMLAIVLIGLALVGRVSDVVAFFGGGSGLLIALLALLLHWLRYEPRGSVPLAGRTALVRLGVRNARRHPGRSMLTAGLIAVATFEITALQAMRLTVTDTARGRAGATGGFTLLAESVVPLTHDLGTSAGRAALGLSAETEALLTRSTIVPLRLRQGDETSCLNIYRPTQPRVLGVPDELIERGGFSFAATRAETDAERRNPWLLLHHAPAAEVVPAIADEAAARWQLHLELGDELELADESGRPVQLRLVGLLKGSILQGEILVAATQFKRLFPSVAGEAYFLIETPPASAAAVAHGLAHDLTAFGLAVTPTEERLRELFAVQNTYLSTFQALGGLGLLLGTLGLTVVLLRNVWERRSELALLRTLGFSHAALGLLVLVENAFLVAAGLLAGLVSAAVVVTPHVVQRGVVVPWASLLALFGGIFVAGLAAGATALVPALRTRLLPALRSE